MGVFTFVLRNTGGEWTGKQQSGDIEASADSVSALQQKLEQAALAVDSSGYGGVKSSLYSVSPSCALFQAIVGVGDGGGAAPAGPVIGASSVVVGGGDSAVPAEGAASAGESNGGTAAPKKTLLMPLLWETVDQVTEGSFWDDSRPNAFRLPDLDISELESLFSVASASGGSSTKGGTAAPKKTSLMPLLWETVDQVTEGSFWDDSRPNVFSLPDLDISELESLFSVASASDGSSTKGGGRHGSYINKPDKIRLMGRAYNREIMLSTIKKTLPDMIKAILALDSSVLDIDQVENLIKFYPTKEEIEMLKNYTGDKEMLGKCEQFFMELIKVPRIESKLWVYAFKINFFKKVSDLEEILKIVNGAVREVKASVKLAEIMLTMLTLDNGFALNQGTSQGSAIDFKLDILLKFSDNRARNDKRTLMHDLCQLLAEKKPELLDFYKDFAKLEKASKIQLKAVADEMLVLCEDLEKVDQELRASETEFYKVLKTFLDDTEAKMGSLVSSYTDARRFADSLSQYFGANPATCPFEKVTQILVTFVKMFKKTREENKKQGDAEKENLHPERGSLRNHGGQDIMCN